MTNSFVTVDFETANSFRGSVCEIGLVRIVDARVARPPSARPAHDEPSPRWKLARRPARPAFQTVLSTARKQGQGAR